MRRSECALLSVVAQAYVEVVSTRRVDNLVRSNDRVGFSNSQVSPICPELDDASQVPLIGRVTQNPAVTSDWTRSLNSWTRRAASFLQLVVERWDAAIARPSALSRRPGRR